jgi:predicted amidophosphoribosyltransferase
VDNSVRGLLAPIRLSVRPGTLARMTTLSPRSLGAALLDLLLPGCCGGCGAPGAGWCPACGSRLGPHSSPVLPGGPPIAAVGRYRGPLRTAVLAYKERGRRDLAAPLARLLADVLPAGVPPGGWWLVPAPSRPAAIRARGGDHVLRLCRHLARGEPRLHVAAALALGRRARDSVGLDAAQRAGNLAGRVRVRAAALPPPGAAVLLVDDVITTGATLRACCAALGGAGRPVTGAIVLADATPGRTSRNTRTAVEKTTHCRTCTDRGSLHPQICCRTVISDTVGSTPSGTQKLAANADVGSDCQREDHRPSVAGVGPPALAYPR